MLSVIGAFWVAIEKHPLVILGVCSFCGTDGRGFCVVSVAEAWVTEVTLDFADRVCFVFTTPLCFSLGLGRTMSLWEETFGVYSKYIGLEL